MKTFLALTTGFLGGVITTAVFYAVIFNDEIIEACAKYADEEKNEEEPIE